MKVRIGPIEAEVVSVERVVASGSPVIAVPLKRAMQPFEQYYIAGTKSGFACSLCSQDCILAPSGQQIVASGNNPVICGDCMMRMSADPRHEA